MRIVCLSDTHHMFLSVKVPPGDLLLHAGDHSRTGTVEEVRASADWLRAQPHRHKVVLGGNHDFCLEVPGTSGPEMFAGLTYLEDQQVEVEGLSIYGSPWTPEFGRRWAYQKPRGDSLVEVWNGIPQGTDVLVTHGPPAGLGDFTVRGEPAGCQDLLRRVRQVKPALHLFGHIHEGYGYRRQGETLFVNGSSCSIGYVYMQPPHVFDWDGKAFQPVQCWHPSEPLWEFLVSRQGSPLRLRPDECRAAAEMGHGFWVDQRECGGVRFSPMQPSDLAHLSGLPLSFNVRLQEHWYRLLNDNPWPTIADIPRLGQIKISNAEKT